MNSTHRTGQPATAHPASVGSTAPRSFGAQFGPLRRQPALLCALVLMVALMSSYVHLVNAQVERGERFRHGLAQAGQKPAMQTAQWVREAALPALSPVGMDTGR